MFKRIHLFIEIGFSSIYQVERANVVEANDLANATTMQLNRFGVTNMSISNIITESSVTQFDRQRAVR